MAIFNLGDKLFFKVFRHFCLQPSAKDLGITGVVVLAVVLVLLFHLSHFLFKRNLSEKILPVRESFGTPAKHSIN